MKTIIYKGKQTSFLTHKEKAQELGISPKTLTRWKKAGKITDILIDIPRIKRRYYFQNIK